MAIYVVLQTTVKALQLQLTLFSLTLPAVLFF